MQMRSFSYRTRSSINSSFDITGSITKCHNDSLGLKLVHLLIFKDSSAIFHVFMKINEYANYIIYISYHRKQGLFLSFKMRSFSLVYDKLQWRYGQCYMYTPDPQESRYRLPWKPCNIFIVQLS